MKKLDLGIIIIMPVIIFSILVIFNLHINYFISLILFFGIPCVYLSFKNSYKIKMIASFSSIIGFPVAIIFQLLTFGNHAWYVPESILSHRFLGVTPLEDFLWMFLTLYTILLFYEHFFNESTTKRKMNNKMFIITAALYFIALIVTTIFIVAPSILIMPYSYLWLGTIFFLIPSIIFFIKYPHFINNASKTAIFFFVTHTLFEIVGVKLQHWTFPGTTYIGWISIFDISFPIEEFFFVMILGGFAGVVYYEYLTNIESKNNRKIIKKQ